jgi:proliferating cell nuclear antigen
MSKLVKLKTVNSLDLKILFDVLKDVLHEFRMEFIQDTFVIPTQEQKQDEQDNKSNDNNDDEKKHKKHKKEKKELSQEQDNISEKKEEKKQNMGGGGIKILELDEHQTLMIYIKLNSNQFVDFYVKYPKISVGLDLLQLHKFLKTIDKDSMLSIYIDKDDEQNIVFQTINDVKPSTSIYKQKIMDLDDNNKKLPKQSNFEILVTMETVEFHKLCREMHQFADYMEITCTSKEITFKCQGDSNSYIKKFTNSDKGLKITCLNTVNKKPVIVQAIYELRYLVTFGKCVNLCTEMQIYLRNDYPAFFHYTVATLGKMLIGLSPVDEKAIKKDNDYDEMNDQFYEDDEEVSLKKT